MSLLGDEPSVLEEGPLIWALDDDFEIIELLDRIMTEGGYRFRGFLEPGKLLAALDKLGQATGGGGGGGGGEEDLAMPEALILDWMLPELNGHEMLKALRVHPVWNSPPVIVLTALHSESVLINAFEAGAVDLIRKPFAVTELMARLRWRLRESSALSDMRRRGDTLTLLLDLSRDLNHSIALDDVIAILEEKVCHVFDCSHCLFYLQDKTRGELVARHDHASLSLDRSPQVMEALAARRHAQLTGYELEQLGILEAPAGRESSGLLVPTVHDGQLTGAFMLVGPTGHICDGRVIDTLRVAVEMAALAIERIRLVKRLQRRHDEVRENERTLARTRDYLASVIEASPDAIVASASDGEIVLFNGAAERILKISREDALGRNVRMLYPPGGAEAIMRRMRSSDEGSVGRLSSSEEHLLDRDGGAIPVNIAAAILYEEDGREIGSVGVFTDLRQQLLIEERLQRATEDLERSKEQAMMAELAGATAHELNQPLTSLLNYAELLSATQDLPPRARRAAEVIDREAEAIAEIVRKIGKITRYRTRDYVGSARIMELDGGGESE